MLEKDALLKGPQGYTVKERGSDRLFVNTKAGAWFRTNSMGAYILQSLLDGHNSVADVLRILAGEYGTAEDDIESDVMSFLNDAFEHGMCKPVDDADLASDELPSPDTGSPSLALPNELWIHPHARCNLRCPYCYNYGGTSSVKNGNLSSGDLGPLVDYFLAHLDGRPKPSFIISGGEPMLCFDETLEIVRYLKESGVCRTICLLSNGTVGSADEWRQILPLIDNVQFALDGSCPDINDRMRCEGSFEKTVNTIKTVRSIDPEFMIHLRFVVTTHNCSDMVPFLGLASELRVNYLAFCSVYPHGRGRNNAELIPSTGEVTQALDELKRAYQVLRVTGRSGVTVSPGNLDPSVRLIKQCKRVGCGAGRHSLLIAENADVYPCVSMQAPEFLFGNVREDSVADILARGERWADQNSIDVIHVCKDCEYRYICGGSCKATNWHLTGDVRAMDSDLIDEATGRCKWHDAMEERMWSFPDYPAQRRRMAAYTAMKKMVPTA